jgi:thermitase
VLDEAKNLSKENIEGAKPTAIEPNRSWKLPASPVLKTEQIDSKLWGVTQIGAEKIWPSNRGEGVLVAVVDTGVDRNHPALETQVARNSVEEMGEAGIDDDGNGFVDDIFGWDFEKGDNNTLDDQGHGSHVAGTIAGNLLEKNFCGVAPSAQILAVKTHSRTGESREDAVVKGILYAADRGAKVINCSWGGAPEAPDYSQVLFDAIEYANNKGALLVAAAGNDGSNNDTRPTYPANYELPNILTVAATTQGGKLAFLSNYGASTVKIAAPGQGIYSVRNQGGYVSQSGTSMAAPHAAGAAALVIAAQKDSVTPAQVIELLTKNAVPLSAVQGKVTSGFLDVSFLGQL